MEEQNLQDFYRKRRNNLIVYGIFKCLYAFETSAVSLSALYYFQYVVRVENPKLFYSLAVGAISLSSMIMSALVGRMVDRYRNLRKTSFLAVLNVLGNLIYVFPFFNWFPIFGRFLCGIADGVRPAYLGEVLLVDDRKKAIQYSLHNSNLYNSLTRTILLVPSEQR